jgi:hypothetical protein
MKSKIHPTQSQLRETFSYNDGILTWKSKKGKVNSFVGKKVGCVNQVGYVVVVIDRVQYTAHRIIWIMHNGEIPQGMVIDHIDGDKTNNNIENLRCVTSAQNTMNRKRPPSNNTSGYMGVYFDDSTSKKWRAGIAINGSFKHIGRFETKEEAAKAYNEAVKIHREPPYYLNEIP